MSTPSRRVHYTYTEYLALEEESSVRHEFLDGEIYAMARGSPKPGAMARKILDGLGVHSRFSAVVGGDEAVRKPDPSGLLGICDRLGVSPADTVMVGDSVVDHATVVAAGVRFVPVGWGFVPMETLAAAGATGFVQDATGLLPFVGATP